MRVAALCDVHGNLPALEAVLAEVAAPASTGSSAAATSSPGRFRASASTGCWPVDAVFVRGNADHESPRAPAGTWESVADQLERSRRPTSCSALAEAVSLDGVLFCHGSPRDDDEILTKITPDERCRAALEGVEERLVVGGHTHVQFERAIDGIRLRQRRQRRHARTRGKSGAFWALLGGRTSTCGDAVRGRRGGGRDQGERLPRAEQIAG